MRNILYFCFFASAIWVFAAACSGTDPAPKEPTGAETVQPEARDPDVSKPAAADGIRAEGK